jgi:L-2-hydroxyglutarate oxidase LhgO
MPEHKQSENHYMNIFKQWACKKKQRELNSSIPRDIADAKKSDEKSVKFMGVRPPALTPANARARSAARRKKIAVSSMVLRPNKRLQLFLIDRRDHDHTEPQH